MHLNTVLNREKDNTLLSMSAHLSIIRMSGTLEKRMGLMGSVEACPRGCLQVREQIKTCHTNVSISESSHAEIVRFPPIHNMA